MEMVGKCENLGPTFFNHSPKSNCLQMPLKKTLLSVIYNRRIRNLPNDSQASQVMAEYESRHYNLGLMFHDCTRRRKVGIVAEKEL